MKLPDVNMDYIKSYPLVATVGLVAFLAGLVMVVIPQYVLTDSVVATFLPDIIEICWPIMHTTGGLLVVLGMLYGKPNFQAAGLTLLFCTMACYCAAILHANGFASAFVAGSIAGGTAIGCGVRAHLLVRKGSE